MPEINNIAYMEPFFEGEYITKEKLNLQVKDKVNVLIQNQETINTYLNSLLQGASAGVDQAKTIFMMASAPTGWIRDLSADVDSVIRITDGSTAPPGENPTADGGSVGGDWEITGLPNLTASDHTHSYGSHYHLIGDYGTGHTHTTSGHVHTLRNHTHTLASHLHSIGGSYTNSSYRSTQHGDGYDIIYYIYNGPTSSRSSGSSTTDFKDHRHIMSYHNHNGSTSLDGGGTLSLIDTNNTGSSVSSVSWGGGNEYTGAAGTISTSAAGGHTHTPSSSGVWRPLYVSGVACEKN